MYQIPRILIKIDNDQFTKPTKQIPSHELPFYLERYGPTVSVESKTENNFVIDDIHEEWTRLSGQYGENAVLSVFGRPPQGLVDALDNILAKEKNVKNTSKSSNRTSAAAGV
jgi:hypothetical protein|tara:strand:- start:134 stop:469 length:336 start_codon:yes stop_codon:yes gene_type:complete